MSRVDNVAIFKDTERLCKTNQILKESIQGSIARQRLILEQEDILNSEIVSPDNIIDGKLDKNIYDKAADIIISKKRSYEAASAYKGKKICVHNFASASNPGGGVTSGSSAQEESLCRISTLYFCINDKDMWEGFYYPHRRMKDAIHNDDIIYTPNVTVFKSDIAYPKLIAEDKWYKVNVITCAAPNLRPNPSNAFNIGDGDKRIIISDEELLKLHEKRLRRILDVALINKNEVVILGAFGCGAFLNNPKVVALAAKNVINEYRYAFKCIEFAVFCRSYDEQNYTIFNDVISVR